MPTFVSQQIASLTMGTDKNALRPLLSGLADRLSSQALASAGLLLFGASSPLAKTGVTATPAIANGILLSIAASTSLPALAGTTPINTFNVYAFFVDQLGALTSSIGSAGASLSAVRFAPILPGRVGCQIRANPARQGDARFHYRKPHHSSVYRWNHGT